MVLEGENAVAKNREIMGATNPANAAAGTIRKDFATNIEKNTVHGSDSLENAKNEIAYFFRGGPNPPLRVEEVDVSSWLYCDGRGGVPPSGRRRMPPIRVRILEPVPAWDGLRRFLKAGERPVGGGTDMEVAAGCWCSC